ncbi:MAG: hypothetical protein QG608_593, partial [Actinomycetota bacterium]|nr:hypothetical protein [Actinomycetota bacterium]
TLTVDFSPDGTQVATAGDDTDVRLWDAATGRVLTVLTGHTEGVNEALFSPDGTRLVTAGDDGTARIWDTATGRCLAVLAVHDSWVTGARFSPDGSRIATVSQDARTRIWDTATGLLLATFTGHTDAVRDVVFSPDGARVLTGSSDTTARLRSLPPSWSGELCRRAGRNLTRSEWTEHLGNRPYERQCPQWRAQDVRDRNAPLARFPALERRIPARG